MKNTGKMILAVALLAATATSGFAEATKIVMDGSTTVGPIAKAFAEYYMGKHNDVNITVSESGSGNGAKSILNGTCDIANMSRSMKEEELLVGKEKGLNIIEHIVAMDGIAVVVHPDNPIEGLTKEELVQIYNGEIRNWKKLGGPDLPIVVISRDTNSGTYESFQQLVTKSERITDSAEYVGSNGAIRQRVMTTTGAIGYVGLAFMEGLKPLTINGVEPTQETVLNRSYIISRPLFMYTNGEPAEGSHLAAFLGLYKTADGRKIVEEQGFVPVK